MKTAIPTLSLTLLILLPISRSLAEEQAPGLEEAARTLAKTLQQQDFETAVKSFDTTMKEALPPDRLEQIWKDLLDKVGPLKKTHGTRSEKKDKYDIVYVACEFGNARLDMKVVFDSERRITGLFFVPAKKNYTFAPPPYARPDSYTEKDISIPSDPGKLPGTLTLPTGDGPFPAVVLVHGSGPQDRDETIGPNKPFRDLAWGLASKGIAVLRYEKRTYAHSSAMVKASRTITIKEEAIDDALSAVSILRMTPGIDPKRIFIVGHSLGATVAPRIAQRDPTIAGLVLLAGNSRPLEDVILEQVTYILSLSGELTDAQKKQLDEIKKQVQKAKDPDLSPDTPAEELPFRSHAAYWLALRKYDQTGTAARLPQPLLILQGERDYQVTLIDFEGWKKALAGKKNATFKSYPDLNHLFMTGKGRSTPSEYDQAGHLSETVVNDIATWIKERRDK